MSPIKLVYCIDYCNVCATANADVMTVIYGYLKKFFNNIEKIMETDIDVLQNIENYTKSNVFK